MVIAAVAAEYTGSLKAGEGGGDSYIGDINRRAAISRGNGPGK